MKTKPVKIQEIDVETGILLKSKYLNLENVKNHFLTIEQGDKVFKMLRIKMDDNYEIIDIQLQLVI